MTKEYALHLLNQLMIGASVDAKPIIPQYELAQALDLAIKALEHKALEQQPCEDCISRAYIAPIIEELEYDQMDNDYALSLLSDIKNAPSVALQRPKGKWIKTEGSFRCSECLTFPEYIRTLNYCPSCGSYNGGGEKDED